MTWWYLQLDPIYYDRNLFISQEYAFAIQDFVEMTAPYRDQTVQKLVKTIAQIREYLLPIVKLRLMWPVSSHLNTRSIRL